MSEDEMVLDPVPTYDCLFLAREIQRAAGAVAAVEIHLFAYLSCLLWLYRGEPLADWGYRFAGTELGAPFSIEIDRAIRSLRRRGFLVDTGSRMRLSSIADDYLTDFRQLELNRPRSECLTAASATTAAFSLGIVGNAIAEESDLRRARVMRGTRQLLEEAAQETLHEQFTILRYSLEGADSDLRVPAVVWLEALYLVKEQTPE